MSVSQSVHGTSSRYVACGLSIVSDAPIPGLVATADEGPADLHISIHGAKDAPRTILTSDSIWYVSAERSTSGAPWLTIWDCASDNGYRLSYGEGAEYCVDRAGAHVRVFWKPPLTDVDAATYLLGPVLGFVMRLRGTVPLHASAIAIGGRAVLFVGGPGAGKSTTAAAFATLGYPVLSDDIVPIAWSERGATALPGYPRVSIWPDSVEALFGSADALPSFSSTYDKCYLDLLEHGYQFHGTPAPIDVIYVLGGRVAALNAPEVRQVGQRDALMALIANTYSSYLLDGGMRACELHFLSRVVQHVPVKELSLAEPADRLVEFCGVLASDPATSAMSRT